MSLASQSSVCSPGTAGRQGAPTVLCHDNCIDPFLKGSSLALGGREEYLLKAYEVETPVPVNCSRSAPYGISHTIYLQYRELELFHCAPDAAFQRPSFYLLIYLSIIGWSGWVGPCTWDACAGPPLLPTTPLPSMSREIYARA